MGESIRKPHQRQAIFDDTFLKQNFLDSQPDRVYDLEHLFYYWYSTGHSNG